jgi:hypothetical protein
MRGTMLTIVSAPAPRPDTTRLQRLVHLHRAAAAAALDPEGRR